MKCFGFVYELICDEWLFVDSNKIENEHNDRKAVKKK